jgi:uncharacterized protein involved in exopolysaccharide biosynthesis
MINLQPIQEDDLENTIVNRYRPLPTDAVDGVVKFSNSSVWRVPVGNPAEIPTFLQLMQTLWQAKWGIMFLALLGGLLTGMIGLSRPVLYEAKAQLITSSQNLASTPAGTAVSQESINETIDSHLTRLMSQAQLRRAIALLEAQGETEVVAKLQRRADNPGLVDTVTRKFRSWNDQLLHAFSNNELAIAKDIEVDSNSKLIEVLRSGLRVGQELRSRVISVGFTDTDRATAAIVANAVVQAYVAQLTAQNRVSYQRELASTIERIPFVQNELANAIKKKDQFVFSTEGIGTTGAPASSQEISQLKQLLSVAQANLAAIKLQVSGGQIQLETPAGLRLPPDTVQPEIAFEAGREAPYFEQQIAALEWQINRFESAERQAAGRLSSLRALELEVEAEAGQYKDMLAKRESLRQHADNPFVGVSVLSAAWAPTNPKTISPLFLIPPGVILFGLLASFLAVLRNSLSDTIRNEAESEAALGIPSAGRVPELNDPTAHHVQRQILGPQNTLYRRALSSIFVSIAPLKVNPKAGTLVLLTSQSQHDRKNELSWGLALTAKRFGHHTLFVDLDTQATPQEKSFWHMYDTGFAASSFGDFVSGNCLLQDAVLQLPDAGIHFMAAPQNIPAILASTSYANIQNMVDTLRQEYSMIIINGLTADIAPEIRLLTTQTDAIVFAIGESLTKRAEAQAALKLLSQNLGRARLTSVLTA